MAAAVHSPIPNVEQAYMRDTSVQLSPQDTRRPSSRKSCVFSFPHTQHASRINVMRCAESNLMTFAHRYGTGENRAKHPFQLEVLDTKIPRSVVTLKNGNKCRLYSDAIKADVKLGQDNYLIMHGIKATSENVSGNNVEPASAPLVLLHGYGNGALYFYRNLRSLADTHFGTVYSLDMLGWGLSSRPTFQTADDSVEAAEDFFVESLEAWRDVNNIPKMTLAGHSMGGYLSVAYCEKYPERVERLILLSPVGVPRSTHDPNTYRDMPLKYRLMMNFATSLWNRGTTPGSIVRSMPCGRGRRIVERYIEGRLPSITCAEEQKALTDYLYSNTALPGSGEYALNRILTPTADAKKPAVYRIPKLKVKSISFIYGVNDWMDINGGLDVHHICEEMKLNRMEAPDVEVHGVSSAGHLLMLDNWEEFNSAVLMAAGAEYALPENAPRPSRWR